MHTRKAQAGRVGKSSLGRRRPGRDPDRQAASHDERLHGPESRHDDLHDQFGHGVHSCVGMHLAKMEITALLRALLQRVRRFELGTTRRLVNNILRGLSKVEVTVH